MTAYAIDSIGFSGTTSLVNVLNSLQNTKAVHGTRNFKEPGPMGKADTSVGQFFKDMQDATNTFGRVVAVHFNFQPQEASNEANLTGVKYFGLVRRTEDQIQSCFNWYVNQITSGRQDTWLQVHRMNSLIAEKQAYQSIGVSFNFANIVYMLSINHILSHNMAILQTGAEILKIEELLGDEKLFRKIFEVSDTEDIPHFSGVAINLNSHKERNNFSELMAHPDSEILNQSFTMKLFGKNVTVGYMNDLMQY